MNSEHEKAGIGNRTEIDAAMYALGVASVALALVGQAGSAAGAGWAWRAFFAIASGLLDLLFAFEFFLRLFRDRDGRPRPGALTVLAAGFSSVLPLLLASGPFLFAWAAGDLGSNAIRGYYADPGLAGALSTAASLRLIRPALACLPYRGGPPVGATGSDRRTRTAMATASALALLLGILSDACLLPTHAALLADRRQATLTALEAMPAGDARTAAAAMPDLRALRLPALRWTRPGSVPASPDLAFFSTERSEAWFTASDLHRSRGLSEAALSLLALGAWLSSIALPRREPGAGRRPPRRPPEDCPAGCEELNGLLGKRLP